MNLPSAAKFANDKMKCIQCGNLTEEAFYRATKKVYPQLNIRFNNRPKMSQPDFAFEVNTQTILADLKTCTEAFYSAQKYISLHPSEAIPINLDKIFTYSKYKNSVVITAVDMRFGKYSKENTYGLFSVSIEKMKRLMEQHPNRIRQLKDRANFANQSQQNFYATPNEMERLDNSWFDALVAEIASMRQSGEFPSEFFEL